MAGGGGGAPRSGRRPLSAWEARVARLLGLGPVRLIRAVLDGYAAVGGGLLSSGLAYSALFALVPGILLILGVSGAVLGESRLHDRFVESVVEVVPPLRSMLEPAMDELTSRAGSITTLGIIGLAWGASRFYTSFEEALGRVFGGASRRGFVRRTVLGIMSVVALGAVFFLVTILAAVRAFVTAAESTGGRPLVAALGILIDVAGPIATALAIAGIYRLVPPRRPQWRAVALPSIVVSAALVVVARAFVFLAPRLIGAAAVLGTVATVFAALAWLSITFQAILVGAAWIDVRDRRRNEETIAAS